MDSTNQVIRWRAKVTVSWANKLGAFRGSSRLSFTSLPGNPPANGSQLIDSSDPSSGSYQYISDWVTQPAGIFLDDIRTAASHVSLFITAYVASDVGSLTFTMGTTQIEADLDSAGTPAAITSIATGGYDLEVFADLSGYDIPGTEPGDFSTAYEFDNIVDFSLNSGIGARTVTEDTGDKVSGTTSFKLSLPAPADEYSMVGEASTWNDLGSGQSAATFSDVSAATAGYSEDVVKIENTSGFTDDGSPVRIIRVEYPFSPDADFTDKMFLVDIKLEITGSAQMSWVEYLDFQSGNGQEFYTADDGNPRAGANSIPSSGKGLIGNNAWQTIAVSTFSDPAVSELKLEPLGSRDDDVWGAGDFAIYIGKIRSIDIGTWETDVEATASGISPTLDLSSEAGNVAMSAKFSGEWPSSMVQDRDPFSVTMYWSGGADSPASATPRNYITVTAGHGVGWTRTEGMVMAEGSPTNADVVDAIQIVFTFSPFSLSEFITLGLYVGTDAAVRVDMFETQELLTLDDPYFGASAPVGDSNPIQHPLDALRYWIETVLGATLDLSHWTDVLKVDVDAALKIAGDIRTVGLDTREVTARLAFEAGANLVPTFTSAGIEWRILAPRTSDLSWAKGATLTAISEWDRAGVAQVGRDLLSDLFTRYTFVYAPEHSLGTGEEAFTGILTANPTVSGVTGVSSATLSVLESSIGIRVAPPVAFQLIQDTTTAAIIAGYYVAERVRRTKLFALAGVPWWDSYDLEVGDLRSVTPPWGSTAIDCRVIEVDIDPRTEQRELRLVEVT